MCFAQSQLDTLRKKFEAVENERDHLRENERVMEEKVCVHVFDNRTHYIRTYMQCSITTVKPLFV